MEKMLNLQADKERLVFLDNVRAFIVFTVVAFHAAVTYKTHAVPWWYVTSRATSKFFDAFIAVNDTFLMPALFFVSGYFALPSLLKRGRVGFVKDKFIRLQLPALIGAFVMVPVLLYSRSVGNMADYTTILGFWLKYLESFLQISTPVYAFDDQFNYSYLWFLTLLFAFFTLLALIYTRIDFKRYLKQSDVHSSFGFKGLLVFGGGVSVAFILVHLIVSEAVWVNLWHLLMFQVTRFPIYLGFFILGVHGYAKGWVNSHNFIQWGRYWVPVAFVLGVVFINFYPSFYAKPTFTINLLHGFIRVFLGLSLLMSALCAMSYIDKKAGLRPKVLVDNSYGVYLFHMAMLIPLQHELNSLNIDIYVKYGLAFMFASSLSLVITYALRKSRVMRAVL